MGNPPPKPGKGRPPGRNGGAGSGPRGPVRMGGRGRGTSHRAPAPKKGCAVLALVMLGGLLATIGGAGYGLVQAVL